MNKLKARLMQWAVSLIMIGLVIGLVWATAWIVFQVVRPWEMTFWWAFWITILFYLVLAVIRATFKD